MKKKYNITYLYYDVLFLLFIKNKIKDFYDDESKKKKITDIKIGIFILWLKHCYSYIISKTS